MRVNALTAVLAASCASLAVAVPAANYYPNQYSTSTTCQTKYATTSNRGPYSTYWSTHTTACTLTSTITVQSTSTLPRVTSTSTTTIFSTSTAPTTTSTATSVVTSTVQTSVTTTTTATTYATATSTSTTTTIIPPPSGFIPVQTSLPGTSYSGSEGVDPAGKRDVEESEPLSKRYGGGNFGGGSSKPQYPIGVNCQKFQPSSTCATTSTTVTTIVTASAPPPTTSTVSTTVVVTSYPGASTTITNTATSTSTISYTATTTATSTTTVTAVATSVLYAQCASNNMADTYNGAGTQNIISTGTSSVARFAGPTDAYSCCVAVIADPNSDVFYFNYNGDKTCYATETGSSTCPANQGDSLYFLTDGSPGSYGTGGNSNCGQINAAQSE